MLKARTHGETRLQLRDVHAWYGQSHILHGMSFDVYEGEVVTLLGRNGAGKTTTMRAIMGLLDARKGSITVRGAESIHLRPEQIARLGVGYCPEERGVFGGLTLRENLLLPPILRPGGMTLAEIYRLFPNLLERGKSPGAKLSGGEQQMLAMARILRSGVKILLLDEPTEGLAPVIVQQIGRALRILKERGFTILLVEQNFVFAAGIADRHYLVEGGRVVDTYRNDDVDRREHRVRERLGL
jgi:branched-chain amino acid transport system ATP-binding protein